MTINKEKIKEACEEALNEIEPDKKEKISAIYLYGSIAKEREREYSDIDIAILTKGKTDKFFEEILSLKIEEKMQKRGVKKPVEARKINGKSISYQHQVLKHGELLLELDKNHRIKKETEIYKKYLDTKPIRRKYHKKRRKRILEGELFE